ncbi:MAG: FtsW/RodA/SpoVE family cell cycle protein [Prevotella sp.]|nr:FtsW/RodA/SpoVE family cell cycle protein [Prevotella sp.]
MKISIGNIFKGDKVIWMIFFFLCIISILEVFSSSSSLTYDKASYWGPVFKHTAILLLGILLMVIVQNIDCKYFKIATPFLLIISGLTLVWVLAAGQSTNGAQRWVSLFGIQFQPSEIAKGTIVLAVAQILSAMQTEEGTEENTFKYIMFTVCPLLLLIVFENLSTAMLIGMVVVGMMFFGHVSLKTLGKLLGGFALFVVVMLAFILIFGRAEEEKPNDRQNLTERVETTEKDASPSFIEKIFHRAGTWKGRILKFVNSEEVTPDKFDLDEDSQIGHANIAIASSEIVGKGPGNSEERDMLPQAFSDFIYAIIIEELGLAGGIVVMLLYIFLLFRAGRIADRCVNAFPAFLVMGLALLLVSQAMFNMLVAVGLAPVTGQPLPLISKGGTSTIINCIYIGAILSMSISAKKKNTLEMSLPSSSNKKSSPKMQKTT